MLTNTTIDKASKAIYDTYFASQLPAMIGSRFYRTRAPQTEQMPYIVYRIDGYSPEEKMGDPGNRLVNFDVVIQIVCSSSDGGQQAIDIDTAVQQAFNWQQLADNCVAMQPVSTGELNYTDRELGRVIEITKTYELTLEG